MRSLIMLVPVLLGACAAQGPTPPLRHTASVCQPNGLEQFNGQAASAELGVALLRASGAKVIRWVQPGQAVTLDFSPHRLTVRLDSSNRVISATCG